MRFLDRSSDPGRGWRAGLAPILFGAGALATAEIAAGILIGRFFDWGRAEALLFFAFRPWLVLVGAMMIAGAGWRRRYALYALFLLVAGLAETLLLMPMGAANPWPEMLRGWAAGALLAVFFDLFIQTAGRFGKDRGRFAASLVLAFGLLIPGALRPYETIILDQPGQSVSSNARPAVTVLTSLPIVWGEAGPFEPGAGPAQSWLELQREFTLRPIDYIDSENLHSTRLILLAQPRQLAPEELVTLDAWVRGGGRILILADPALLWPSRLPLGLSDRVVRSLCLAPCGLGRRFVALRRPAADADVGNAVRRRPEVRMQRAAAADDL